MTSLRITGGVPLSGQVTGRGAKNLVPKARVAALLGSTASTLGNVPEIKDVKVVTDLLALHGVEVTRDDALGELTLDPTNVTRARHADINIPDLRGGFSHLIAALSAEGVSTVTGVELIKRGYEHFTDKLSGLGANFDVAER